VIVNAHPSRPMANRFRCLRRHAVLFMIVVLFADHALAFPAIDNGSMDGTPGAGVPPAGWSYSNEPTNICDASGPFNNTGVDWTLSPDGGTFARINAPGDPQYHEGLVQTVDGFEPGIAYSFDFYITNLGFYFAAADEWRDRPGFIVLYVDDVLVGQSSIVTAPATKTDPIQWSADGISFVASNVSHTLRFESRTADAGGATAYIGADGVALSLSGATTTTSVPTTSTSSVSSTTTSSSSTSSSSTNTTSPSTSTSSSTSTSTSVPGSSSTTSTSSTSITTSTSSTSSTTSSSSTTTTVLPGSTTTTSTSTSTTTTVAPLCVPGVCDDGDACTTDTCEPLVGCIATPLAGLDGVACRLDQLSTANVCGDEPVDLKLATFVEKRVERSLRFIDKALEATKERKVRKQVRKIKRTLKKIARRVAKFERKERITPECAEAFQTLLCQLVSETDVAGLALSPCPF